MANNDTKRRLLLEGYALAKQIGVSKLTHNNVAKKAVCSRNTITHYYGTIEQFRSAVLAYGIEKGTMKEGDAVTTLRMAPAERSKSILDEAFKQAAEKGLGKFTRLSVAEAIGVTDGLINRYFKGLDGLRDAVLARSVLEGNIDIVADAVEMGLSVHHVPPDLLNEAKRLLAA